MPADTIENLPIESLPIYPGLTWTLVVLAIIGLCRSPRIGWLSVAYFFMQWLITELSWVLLTLSSLTLLWQLSQGALGVDGGWWYSLLLLGASLGYWRMLKPALHTDDYLNKVMDIGLGDTHLQDIQPDRLAKLRTHVALSHWLRPFHMRHSQVAVERGIRYGDGQRHTLDVYRPKQATVANGGQPLPVLLQIHGGGWMIGEKEQQALPLMNHLAANGWLCVSINYHLSPKARFPDHIIDAKRALVWVKEHIAEYGGNPDFIIATGGSAGGHLCSLMALTANTPRFQPGFEQANTEVQGCVPFYGVYDLLDRHKTRAGGDAYQNYLTNYIMAASPTEDPELWTLGSPLDQVHDQAPPFMIVHGEYDTLSYIEEARHFAKAMRDTSNAPAVYAELEATQHAFEVFNSPRTAHTVNAVQRFAEWCYSQYLLTSDKS